MGTLGQGLALPQPLPGEQGSSLGFMDSEPEGQAEGGGGGAPGRGSDQAARAGGR